MPRSTPTRRLSRLEPGVAVFGKLLRQSNDRTYLYTVERTDIATDGSLTLRTQAEVDAFARSGINTVEGNLTIGGEDEENPVTNLDGLKNLVSVRCDLTITAAIRVKHWPDWKT